MALQNKQNKFNEKLGLAEVELAKESDLGRNDTTIRTLTHLGNFLKAGDHVMGYDISHANLVDLKGKLRQTLPEVILVKKFYPKKNRAKKRQWKLKSLAKEAPDKPVKKGEIEKDSADMELFLQDLEEDPEMRANVNLYRSQETAKKKTPKEKKEKKEESTSSKSTAKGKQVKGKGKTKLERKESTTTSESEVEDDGEIPQVPEEELIDELADAMSTMGVKQGGTESGLKDIVPDEDDEEPITFG